LLLPDEMGVISPDAVDLVLDKSADYDALLVGPGLTSEKEAVEFVHTLFHIKSVGQRGQLGFVKYGHGEEASPTLPPLIVDADGLNALAQVEQWWLSLTPGTVLTPHPGEMARLTNTKASDIQLDRTTAVLRFVERHKCCLILKGARTMISMSPDRIYINTTGGPALSSGGSGDVLTGIISGLLARGMPVMEAATAGVYIHGMAADLMAEEMGDVGVIAGDLPDAIPRLIKSLKSGEWPLKKKQPVVDYRGFIG